MKLTSSKTLVLKDVIHVSNIKKNLIYVSLLGEVGIKVSFESNKIVMTKNNMFVRTGYHSQGLFILNVFNVLNENTSSAYLLDYFKLWHMRLRHVNNLYVMKMKKLRLILMLTSNNMTKCQICAESKLPYVTFIDDYSRYTKVYLIRNKNEAFPMLQQFKKEGWKSTK